MLGMKNVHLHRMALGLDAAASRKNTTSPTSKRSGKICRLVACRYTVEVTCSLDHPMQDVKSANCECGYVADDGRVCSKVLTKKVRYLRVTDWLARRTQDPIFAAALKWGLAFKEPLPGKITSFWGGQFLKDVRITSHTVFHEL